MFGTYFRRFSSVSDSRQRYIVPISPSALIYTTGSYFTGMPDPMLCSRYMVPRMFGTYFRRFFQRVWFTPAVHCTNFSISTDLYDWELFHGHAWPHAMLEVHGTSNVWDLFPGVSSVSDSRQRYIVPIFPLTLIYTRLQLWKLEVSLVWLLAFLGYFTTWHCCIVALYQTPCFIIWKERYCDILYDTDCISSDVSPLPQQQGHGSSFSLFPRSI